MAPKPPLESAEPSPKKDGPNPLPSDSTNRLKRLVLVTGFSGAGKSSALKHLEDLNFVWVDNLPLQLIPSYLDHFADEGNACQQVAIGIHIRGTGCLAPYQAMHHRLQEMADSFLTIFLEADPEVLVTRYRETRRRHPLAIDRTLHEAIQLEAQHLEPVRATADILIDTTRMTVSQLKERLDIHFQAGPRTPDDLLVFLRSFGIKYRSNTDADMVLDARFLANPFYDPELRLLSGLDHPVRSFLDQDGEALAYLDRLQSLFDFLIPRYRKERKRYLTVDIGCTGGRHRSVYLVERLAERLRGRGYQVQIRHRDLNREGN